MSHFSALVLLPPDPSWDPRDLDASRELIEARVAAVLDRYDENKEVSPYQKRCHCAGIAAQREAQDRAKAEFEVQIGMSFDAYRDKYWEEWGDKEAGFNAKKPGAPEWEVWIRGLLELEEKYFEEHPDKDKPNPTCGFYTEDYCPADDDSEAVAEWRVARDAWCDRHPNVNRMLGPHPSEMFPDDPPPTKPVDAGKIGKRFEDKSGCGGTGFYESTYSPESKWDWFVIGGRWTGYLDDYDPRDDPDNWELCDLCNGTGLRTDELGNKEREKNLDYTCNGCQGKGRRVSWSYRAYHGDIRLVRDIRPEVSTFAVVTPDGEWHQHGEMGWFGQSSNHNYNWEEQFKALMEEHKDCVAVLVDCHI